MEDLTIREKDKKDFITKILLDDGFKSFKVVYADGHIEEKEFTTVHNFNVYLHLMKEQYFRYEKDFRKEMHSWIKDSVIKGLIELFASVEALILTGQYVSNDVVKVAMMILIVLFSLGYLFRKMRNTMYAGISLEYADNVERFINIQEQLKVPVYDSKTGRGDEWYLTNLSDINLFTDVKVYEVFARSLDDEAKEEEGAVLSKALKGE